MSTPSHQHLLGYGRSGLTVLILLIFSAYWLFNGPSRSQDASLNSSLHTDPDMTARVKCHSGTTPKRVAIIGENWHLAKTQLNQCADQNVRGR